MKGFPSRINTKKDVLRLVDDFPAEVSEFMGRLLDERKHWAGGQWVDNPDAVLFRMGFTTEEAAGLVIGGYTDPPEPDPPLSPEEQAAAELQAWRESTECGPLQFRRALRQMGEMETIDAFMGAAPEEVVEAWEYATRIVRLDPLVLALQQQLGRTDEEVDDLFRLALTFP